MIYKPFICPKTTIFVHPRPNTSGEKRSQQTIIRESVLGGDTNLTVNFISRFVGFHRHLRSFGGRRTWRSGNMLILAGLLLVSFANAIGKSDNDSTSDGVVYSSDSLAEALDFYNTRILRSNWDSVGRNLSVQCQEDMQEYLGGLNTAKNWALKSWYHFSIVYLPNCDVFDKFRRF